jgi:cyclopropane fatty-acyl-phospholipid synthase-like methyltransferase
MPFKFQNLFIDKDYSTLNKRFFGALLREGEGDRPASVGWYNTFTQQIRFQVLSEVANLAETSVLDVGSGLGDFSAYLNNQFADINYLGIDLFDKYIAKAKLSYPDTQFEHSSLTQLPVDKYDVVFSSGAFNVRVRRPYEYLFSMIDAMWERSGSAIAFNCLSAKVKPKKRLASLMYYDPVKVYDYASKLSTYVSLRHDYLFNDFTIYIYR